MGLFTRRNEDSVHEHTASAQRTDRRAQAVNQAQAAQAAGRGRRGGITARPATTRTQPSRRH